MPNQPTEKSKLMEPRTLLKTSYDLEGLLIDDARTLLSEKFDLQTRSSLLALLNRLILNLSNVLELSSQDGYLRTVLEKRPGWSRRINTLYQSNLDCVATLSLVRDCLENDTTIAAISSDLELRLQNWIDSLSTMRRLESTLLQEAFMVDLGGEA